MNRIASSMILFLSLAFGPFASVTAQFPDRPISIIVPFGTGSGVDTVMRRIQPELEKKLGVPVLILNRGGAGGQIGTKAIADASPDGYTIGMSTVSTFSVNQVFTKSHYDVTKDFSYLTRIGSMPRLMAVNSHFPYTDHGDFLKELSRHPTKYFYTTVVNSVDMLNAEIYKEAVGAKMSLVTYPDNKGGARVDLKANIVHVTFDSLPVLQPYLTNGDLRPIAITGRKRHPGMQSVPTFVELGINELSISSWYGFVGPAGIPSERVDVLTRALHDTLNTANIRDALLTLGVVADVSTGAEHLREVIHTREIYERAGKKLGIQPQ